MFYHLECRIQVMTSRRVLYVQDDDVRTVIKVPAMSWNEESQLEQSRWAHFTADRHNHLLSTVTRLGPSPDWCVGMYHNTQPLLHTLRCSKLRLRCF